MATQAHFETRWQKFVDNCGSELTEAELADIRLVFDFQARLLTEHLHDDAPQLAKPAYKVAYILVNEINLRRDAVVASVLLYLVELGLEQEAKASPFYRGKIQQLVDDGLRIRAFQTVKIDKHTDNFIKLILTLSTDMRVILVELAWRLYRMRRFDQMPAKEQAQVLEESKRLYAPIAHRLGLYAVKTELEDLWLKHSQPETYRDIARKLDETKRDRERFIAEFIAPIRQRMDQAQIDCEIKGRPKSIYSIWNKMQKQAVGFEKVYDKFAIRIIVNATDLADEKPLCWHVYSLVTEHYRPFPKRLRDWISAPKSSGYESLHTTVETESGKWVEVQIRTRRMDDIAERGQAAHWKYKEKEGADALDKLLTQMRQALETPEDERDANQSVVKDALYEKDIFIFTPKGDLHKLRAQATVLDFAFQVHTEVGATCKGANVNGKFVTNRHVLQNADTVEVITSRSVKPSPAWINYVVSPRSKAKIRRLLKEQQYTYADLGKEMLHFKLKQWKVDKVDEAQHRLMKLLGIESTMELFDAIALERIELLKYKKELIGVRRDEPTERSSKMQVENTLINRLGNDPLVIEQGRFSMDYSMARCCNPIPGDDIFGFVTVRQSIKIHKLSCPNAADLMTRYAYRVIPARWADRKGEFRFLTTLRCEATDRPGLVNDITRQILETPSVLLKAIEAKGRGTHYLVQLTLEVENQQNLEQLRKKILRLAGIRDAYRPE